MKIFKSSSIYAAQTLGQLKNQVAQFLLNVELALTNKLTFTDNFRGQFIDVTFDTSFVTVRHNLGVVPKGWFMIRNDNLVTVADQGIFTETEIGLKCTSTGVTVRIFIFAG